jgi:hypothetical protein
VEPVDHVRQAHGEADVDDLFFREVARQCGVRRIVDWIETRRLLRIGNDGSFLRLVDIRRQRIIEQMFYLRF